MAVRSDVVTATGNPDFGREVAIEARARAVRDREFIEDQFVAERHAEALNELGRSVEDLHREDPYLVALWGLQFFAGRGTSGFVAGPEQARVLTLLGIEGEAPPHREVVAELIAAGTEDLAQELTGRVQEARRAVEPLRLEVEELRAALGELEVVRGQVSGLTEERDEARRAVAFWRDAAAFDEGPAGKVARPRRTVHPDHSGIYLRENADGQRVYEITYREPDGRRRWRKVGTDLDEAVRARDEQVNSKAVAA